MSLPLVTSSSAYPGNSLSSINVTTGQLIVVGFSYSNSDQSPTIGDTAGGGTNSYTSAAKKGQATGTTAFGHLFYAVAKATETLTVSTAAESDGGIHLAVYSNNVTSLASVLGQSSSFAEGAASNQHTSAAITTGGSDEQLVVAYWFQETSASSLVDVGSGFVIETDQQNHTSHYMDKAVTSTGTYSCNASSSANDGYISLVASFKAIPGGVIPSTGAYAQESSTSDRYQLEDGSGVYLIEPWGPQGGTFFPPRWWGDLDGIGKSFPRDRLG